MKQENTRQGNPQKTLHGNAARIDPRSYEYSTYLTQAITSTYRFENNTPMVDDQNVERARNFVNENKK